mmetsp:Transcript_62872/g.99815  ORF Transcript_62872/g.99815 Transcript_62872/m.99815 type:complete len:269 (-) Transcript_62872:192-998(-)|eukprot:CAMPEP_0197062600 /NCGR_PEP_ID=MMETSP1384-20130603/146311_1 /TAXON_ID=29189 /ORGANISM="Ammonia sp." /LENGTH=268 /DNA_ID=CAMNT_0042498625 /DNA_START=33 /DNA_END=839 /DNA_ORIENTATION=+
MSLLSLIVFWRLFLSLSAQSASCVWDNGLDLSPLSGLRIQCAETNNPNSFLVIQMCQGNLPCTVFDMNSYMVTQISLSGNCQAGIAKLDQSFTDIAPTAISFAGKQAWFFDLDNGEASFSCSPDPRMLDLTFVCDENGDPYDESQTMCGEDALCQYHFTIYTKYACVSAAASDSDGGLSTGSVLLIILLSVCCCYCCAGYLFNGMRHPDKRWDDVEHNCPNLSFWKLLPQLVGAGCAVSFEFVKAKLNKEEGPKRGDAYNELSNDVEE